MLYIFILFHSNKKTDMLQVGTIIFLIVKRWQEFYWD